MKHGAKRVEATAIVEGRTELLKIRFDLDYLPDNLPVAVLQWDYHMELPGALTVLLCPELLFQSEHDANIYSYQNEHLPIRIPKDLATRPSGLTQEAFRLGFVLP